LFVARFSVLWFCGSVVLGDDMRILQVTPGYAPELGGIERHVQDVSEALAWLGHDVVVVTMTADARLPRHEVVAGVEIRRLPAIGPRDYRLPLGLAHYLRQQRFDIVHAHNYHALPMLLAAMACGARCIVSPYYHGHGHSRTADLLHGLYRPVGRAALRRAGGIVCLSESEADLVAGRLGIARADITVIPSILALPADAAVPTSQRPAGTSRTILSVGRLEAYKRLDRAITALPYLPKDYRLMIVGEGAERPRIERLVAAPGLADRIHLLGRVDDGELAGWYEQAQLAITFSEAESFGRTIVEALAHGCQVVCGDIPAFRDLAAIYPETITLVAPDARDQEVAALIAAAAARPWSPLDMRRYSWRSVAEELLRVYARTYNRYGSLEQYMGSMHVTR
jgi:glycosyltransferase involved in cell wall biosynthesis